MLPTILCLATSRSHAGQITEHLQSAGIPAAEISILALPTEESSPTQPVPASASSGSAEGEKAAAGTVTGGLAGAAAGVGTMSIVGLTPLLILAPAVVALGATAGAALGAAIGTGTAGLSDYGVPDTKVEYFQQKLQAGAYIVAVRTEDEAKLQTARAAFEEAGGQDISLHQLTKKLT